MVITVCKFSKILQGSMPPDSPIESFLVLKLLELKLSKKTALEKLTKIGALPENFSEYTLGIKHFQKAYLRPFLGLSVFVFSQHST